MAMQEIEHKQILGGKSSALVTINSTLYVRCDTRAEFTRFQYSSSSLGQRLQGTSTWELQLFSCPLLAELTSKCLFSEAGVHTVTGQAKTDQGSSQKHTPYFSKTPFTAPSWFYPLVPALSQSCAQLTNHAVTLLLKGSILPFIFSY